MISARFTGSGTAITMRVPGTIFIGPCNQVSSAWRSQVMPDWRSAELNGKPATSPALLPTMPCSVGPTPLRPASTEWHDRQTANAGGAVSALLAAAGSGCAVVAGAADGFSFPDALPDWLPD